MMQDKDWIVHVPIPVHFQPSCQLGNAVRSIEPLESSRTLWWRDRLANHSWHQCTSAPGGHWTCWDPSGRNHCSQGGFLWTYQTSSFFFCQTWHGDGDCIWTSGLFVMLLQWIPLNPWHFPDMQRHAERFADGQTGSDRSIFVVPSRNHCGSSDFQASRLAAELEKKAMPAFSVLHRRVSDRCHWGSTVRFTRRSSSRMKIAG